MMYFYVVFEENLPTFGHILKTLRLFSYLNFEGGCVNMLSMHLAFMGNMFIMDGYLKVMVLKYYDKYLLPIDVKSYIIKYLIFKV